MKYSIVDTNDLGKVKNYNSSLRDTLQHIKNNLFCGATFTGDRRITEQVETSDWLLLDYDSGVEPQTIIEGFRTIIGDFNWIIQPSKSHQKDKGDGKGAITRFHLFIPIKVDLQLYLNGKKELIKRLHFDSGLELYYDRNATDIVRYFTNSHHKILHPEQFIKDTYSHTIEDILKQISRKKDEEAKKKKVAEILRKYSKTEEQREEQQSSGFSNDYSGYMARWNWWKQNGDVSRYDITCIGDRAEKLKSLIGSYKNYYESQKCEKINEGDFISFIDALSSYEADKTKGYNKKRIHDLVRRLLVA